MIIVGYGDEKKQRAVTIVTAVSAMTAQRVQKVYSIRKNKNL